MAISLNKQAFPVEQPKVSFYQAMISQQTQLQETKNQTTHRLEIMQEIVELHRDSAEVRKVFDLLTKLHS